MPTAKVTGYTLKWDIFIEASRKQFWFRVDTKRLRRVDHKVYIVYDPNGATAFNILQFRGDDRMGLTGISTDNKLRSKLTKRLKASKERPAVCLTV